MGEEPGLEVKIKKISRGRHFIGQGLQWKGMLLRTHKVTVLKGRNLQQALEHLVRWVDTSRRGSSADFSWKQESVLEGISLHSTLYIKPHLVESSTLKEDLISYLLVKFQGEDRGRGELLH